MTLLAAVPPALPATLQLERADGTTVSLGELFAADRPILLAFFKADCPTCAIAWRCLERLHELTGAQLRVVGVSQEPPGETRRLVAELGGASFEVFHDPEPGYPASNLAGVEAVPHFVLLAPDGTVTDAWAGWNRDRMAALGARHGAPGPVVPDTEPVPPFKPG